MDFPTVVIELKKPGVPARAALDENLTHYKQQIPALFWFNALLVASNGMDIRERVQGPEHPDVFRSCNNLALCLEAQGKKPEALVFARRALAGFQKTLGEAHPLTQNAKKFVEELEPPR